MKLKFTRVRKLILLLVILAVASALTVEIARGRKYKASDYLTAEIERGVIRQTVSATGALQAVTTVQVGSQVSGTIQSLFADFNSVVKKDQIIAQQSRIEIRRAISADPRQPHLRRVRERDCGFRDAAGFHQRERAGL
jgi:HlyD family secretion protein